MRVPPCTLPFPPSGNSSDSVRALAGGPQQAEEDKAPFSANFSCAQCHHSLFLGCAIAWSPPSPYILPFIYPDPPSLGAFDLKLRGKNARWGCRRSSAEFHTFGEGIHTSAHVCLGCDREVPDLPRCELFTLFLPPGPVIFSVRFAECKVFQGRVYVSEQDGVGSTRKPVLRPRPATSAEPPGGS